MPSVNCFRRCPVGDITVRKIARRAGVGMGMVKYHFQTKDKQEVIGAQIVNLTAELVPGEDMGAPLEWPRQFSHQTTGFALQSCEIFGILQQQVQKRGEKSRPQRPDVVKWKCTTQTTRWTMRTYTHLAMEERACLLEAADTVRRSIGISSATEPRRPPGRAQKTAQRNRHHPGRSLMRD